VATLYEVSGDKTGTGRIARATTHLQEAHTWASMRMESRRRDFSRRYAQYRGNMNVFGKDPVQSQLRSQLWVPKSAALVETVIPRTIGDNPTVEVRGRRAEYADAAQLMGHLLDYYLHAFRFFDALYFWWKDALIYGTSIIKVPWSYKEELRPLPGGNPDADEQQFDMQVIEDMPRIINVDIFDFLFDYTAPTIQKMDFVMERYELPMDIVIDQIRKGKYENITEAEVAAFASRSNELAEDQHFKNERDRAAYGYLGNEGDSAKNQVEQLRKVVLYDYWGRFDVNGDGRLENARVTAMGDKAQRAVKVRMNPYIDGQKPYISANYVPVQNDFLGIGLMEWVEQLQREINTRYNMGVDNANFILNAMLLVRKGASIPDAQLKSRPSGRIDVNEPDDVTPLQMPVVFDKLIAAQQWNDQLWQETTGVGAEFAGVRKGANTSFHRTAGGVLALQQAAEARLKMSRLLFEERSVKPAIELVISRIKQFMDAPITVDIAGPEGVQYLEIKPHQVAAAEYTLKLAIAPTEQIGKLAEREKWQTTLAVLRALDPMMQLFEWGNIIEDWMEATGLPNPVRYLGSMKEKLNIMNQLRVMDSMMTGAPMQGPGQAGGGSGGGNSTGPGAQVSQNKADFEGGGSREGGEAAGGESGRAKE